MNLYVLMARHGYALTFGLLLAEAIGLPFPAAIALVAAGAAVAAHALWGPYILLAAIVALLLGDTVQFWLGRYMGWLLLGSCAVYRSIPRPAFCARRNRSTNAAKPRW